jgi:hypothetical protein
LGTTWKEEKGGCEGELQESAVFEEQKGQKKIVTSERRA